MLKYISKLDFNKCSSNILVFIPIHDFFVCALLIMDFVIFVWCIFFISGRGEIQISKITLRLSYCHVLGLKLHLLSCRGSNLNGLYYCEIKLMKTTWWLIEQGRHWCKVMVICRVGLDIRFGRISGRIPDIEIYRIL